MSETFDISEIFRSIQGEGPSAGTPAHFVRLQRCTVGCTWCDTKYAWPAGKGQSLDDRTLWERVLALGPAPLLVVTGGEPLEDPRLPRLIEGALARWERVEVETSAIAPPPVHDTTGRLAWNVSPKLPSATPRWAETWAHMAAWVAEPRATFKIVVGDPPDPDDALRLIAGHHLPAARVMLMPQGTTDAELRARAPALADLCVQHGFRLSPRLHIWMWGARRGV
jgi:organic radical activating enzyme